MEQQLTQSQQLINMTLVSEEMRKLFSEQLRESLARDEANKNTIFNQSMASQIQQHSISFLQEQFKILFESIHNISADKKLGDKMQFQINELTAAKATMATQIKEAQENNARLMAEKDGFKDDASELLTNKKKVEFDARMQQQSMKQKNEKLDNDLKLKTDDLERLQDEMIKVEKQNKLLLDERDKQKIRITKLISRKGKFDSGLKTCKNCGKEYNEKENFNWSCKQHRGEWGGQMWWCCGKQNKDDRGCKFSSHESKEDEDDDLKDEDASKLKAKKYMRCYCCKELGHKLD